MAKFTLSEAEGNLTAAYQPPLFTEGGCGYNGGILRSRRSKPPRLTNMPRRITVVGGPLALNDD